MSNQNFSDTVSAISEDAILGIFLAAASVFLGGVLLAMLL